jgi:hypothetical protein
LRVYLTVREALTRRKSLLRKSQLHPQADLKRDLLSIRSSKVMLPDLSEDESLKDLQVLSEVRYLIVQNVQRIRFTLITQELSNKLVLT